MSNNNFLRNSLLLFLNATTISVGNLAFWFVISKFVPISTLGQASSITSIILLVGFLATLGLEYPLLKFSNNKETILGSSLFIKSIVTGITIPILVLAVNSLTESSQLIVVLVIAIFVTSSFEYVTRSFLLGIQNVRSVFIFETLGTAAKLLSGYLLAINGFGLDGILFAFLSFNIIAVISTLIIVTKKSKLKIGSFRQQKEMIIFGVTNLPNNLLKTVLINLSIILLAIFNIDDHKIGLFYMALMITFMARIFVIAMATMVIPTASISNRDLTVNSTKFGLVFTMPIIILLLTMPEQILSLIGKNYVAASKVLFVLSFSIIPNIIIINAISYLNNNNRLREILYIGMLQLIVFIPLFMALVSKYEIMGAAIAVVIASISAAFLSIIWSQRLVRKYSALCVIAFIVGIASNYLLASIAVNAIIASLIAVFITIGCMFILRIVTVKELTYLVKTAIGR